MMLLTDILRRIARTWIGAVGSLCVVIAFGATAPEAAAVGAPRTFAASSAMTVTGRVRLADGAPGRNAVVVTSLGGRGVSGDDGSFAFDVDVVRPSGPMHVTAVASIGGVNYAGSLVAPTADVGAITMAAGAQCEPSWLPTFGGEPGLNGTVYALTTFDDGSGKGPELYAGGTFTSAGGIAAKYIARWDGTAWSALGSGVDDTVYSLATFDDGTGKGVALYAGGEFVIAGGTVAFRVARWDGTSWSALGSGTDNRVQALATYDDGSGAGPSLYAGGWFATAGGLPASRIARWDGTAWSSLGGGVNGNVYALTTFEEKLGGGTGLYVGGNFTTADGMPANRIARWDGDSWSPLGSGMDKIVYALTTATDSSSGGTNLYAGGLFTTAGGAAAKYVARWDGAAWSALGTGLNNGVRSLTSFDDGTGDGPTLYAGGYFTTAGGMTANRIARWDGTTWSALGSGVSGGVLATDGVYAMTSFDDRSGAAPTLHAGGEFLFAASAPAHRIASWNGGEWSALGSGMNGEVLVLTTHDDGTGSGPRLYAGGFFTNLGGVAANHVACWDGTAWSALGSGTDGIVRALVSFDDGSGSGPALYAGGTFTVAGDVEASHIARWDGTAWSALGSGTDGFIVRALATFDDRLGGGVNLYAGGSFSTAGGVPASNIAHWNGTEWSPVGGGTNDFVVSLATFDDRSGAGPRLYAGGLFTMAGGTEASHIACWNGTAWSALGSGMNSEVGALTTFDDGSGRGPSLYAGGSFTTAGGTEANRVAKWDGTTWLSLGTGLDSAVEALMAFDDGAESGPALYVGGYFMTAGGTPANNIARWDGTSWSALEGGTSDKVNAFATLDDGSGSGPALFAGGVFTVSPAGDSYLARWQGCPLGLPADLNDDGAVDATDLGILLGAWGMPGVGDIDGDGTTNSVDLAILLGAWTG